LPSIVPQTIYGFSPLKLQAPENYLADNKEIVFELAHGYATGQRW
jgi:hypothetical protein